MDAILVSGAVVQTIINGNLLYVYLRKYPTEADTETPELHHPPEDVESGPIQASPIRSVVSEPVPHTVNDREAAHIEILKSYDPLVDIQSSPTKDPMSMPVTTVPSLHAVGITE